MLAEEEGHGAAKSTTEEFGRDPVEAGSAPARDVTGGEAAIVVQPGRLTFAVR